MDPVKNNIEEDLRICICQFRNKHFEKPKSFTGKYFLDKGVPRSSIYCVLERVADNRGQIRKE